MICLCAVRFAYRGSSTAVFLSSVLTMSFGSLVLAQGIQTSSIVGTVVDSTGAVVPNAVVSLQGDGSIPAIVTTTTDDLGRYRFGALPPGRYDVRSRLAGFVDGEYLNAELAVAATLTVDLILRPAGVRTEITVPHTALLVDVHSAAASAHIDQRFLEDLPTRRVVQDLINFAPGVNAGVGFGGTQDNNAFYLDGVDTTEAQSAKSYLHVNQNWLEEVEVAALGASARYGETTGVSANAILRSGTNRFSGLAEMLVTRPSWLARNTSSLSEQLQRNFAPLDIISWQDTSVQAGGPIVSGRLWYFAGIESFSNRFKPAGYDGPGEEHLRNHTELVKPTVALGKSWRVEGFLNRGAYEDRGLYLGPLKPPETTADAVQPQFVWNARLTWVPSPGTLFEVRNGGYRSDSREDPYGPGTREGPPSHVDVATGLYSINTPTWFDGKRTQFMTAATATSYRDSAVGQHELQGGLEWEHAWMSNGANNPGDMFFTDDNGAPWRVNVWTGQFFTASSRRVGLFLSDNWQVHRLTLAPGIRVDVNRASVPTAADVFSTTPVSPRVGVAWDVIASHRLVLRAHAGRYYDPIAHGRISTLDRSHDETTTVFQILGPGALQRISTSSNSASNLVIDPHVKQAYVDQITSGLQVQIATDATAEINYIYRNFGRFIGMVEIDRRWVPVPRQDPGPDNLPGTADDGEFLTAYVRDPADVQPFYSYSNPEGAYRRYDGIQFIGRKRLSANWQAQASYTWSRTFGTVDNNSGTTGGINDLGTGGGFSNPNRLINQDGRAPYDPRELKILGVGDIPLWGGVTLATVFRYTSGQAWARRATIRNMTLGGTEIVSVEPRGARRLPAIEQIDARVEKKVPLGRAGRLGIGVDVFNVTNQGVPNSDLPFPVQTSSGPFLGVPLKWVDPRLLRVGVRLMF